MGLFGTSPRTAESSMVTPKGECPQCWRHAHDPEVHRGQRGDCPQCVDHMLNGHPGIDRH